MTDPKPGQPLTQGAAADSINAEAPAGMAATTRAAAEEDTTAKAPAGMAAMAAEVAPATEAAAAEAGVATAEAAAEEAAGATRAAGVTTAPMAPSCNRQRHGNRNGTCPGKDGTRKPHLHSTRP